MSKSEIRNVIHNAGYMMITQIALYVAPLFILSYLLKTLGVAQFGNYALILSIVAYLQIITDYGFSFSASRAISQNREDKEYISKIYLSTMTIKLAICAFLFLLLMLFLNLLPVQAELKQGILYGYLLVIGNTFQPQWFFQGIEKLKIIALSNVISRCAACLLVFIYVRNSEDLQKALLVQSLPLVISAIGLNIFILKYINIIFPEKKLFKVILKEGKDFFLASLYSVILNNSGIFLLGIFTNPVIVGVYAAAEKIVKAVLSLFTPLTQAIYPYN
ncbi:TPA: O1 family O-antigen flippase, partial [Escherichia coli]